MVSSARSDPAKWWFHCAAYSEYPRNRKFKIDKQCQWDPSPHTTLQQVRHKGFHWKLVGNKRSKRKRGQRYSCSCGQVPILGFALSQQPCAARIFQNLPESAWICQNWGVSTRKFQQRTPQPPLWHCFCSSQTPELPPVFPGIALSFGLSANPDVCWGPGFQVESVRKRFAAALFNSTLAGGFWNGVSLV